VRSGKRSAELVQARHVGMYLAKQLTSHSLCDIGRCFGNRNHATVLHGCEKIGEWLKRDENLQRDIHALKQVLGR
jgi:chromosomal replication initiator protein